MLQRPWE